MGKQKKSGKHLKIVIIGSSNVAIRMGEALRKAGHKIIQVYSKTRSHAQLAAKELHCEFTSRSNKINPDADVYIIAVNDDQISEVATHLRHKKALVVHTAGSIPMSVLNKCSAHYGVLYPLQTLQKNKKVNFKKIPLLIEGNTSSSEKLLKRIAESISKKVLKTDSRSRKKIHLAAVIVSNFSNHLFDQAQQYLHKNKLPFELLLPLISTTVENLHEKAAHLNQTGPARRNDRKVMQEHLAMLHTHKKLQRLYKLLSDSIVNSYSKEKNK